MRCPKSDLGKSNRLRIPLHRMDQVALSNDLVCVCVYCVLHLSLLTRSPCRQSRRKALLQAVTLPFPSLQ